MCCVDLAAAAEADRKATALEALVGCCDCYTVICDVDVFVLCVAAAEAYRKATALEALVRCCNSDECMCGCICVACGGSSGVQEGNRTGGPGGSLAVALLLLGCFARIS